MPRVLFACTLILSSLIWSGLDADAQRRDKAEIVQGLSSAELADTLQQMRTLNGDLNSKLVELSTDNAALTGKVETLEFLLSQSRDQINQMQEDDVKLNESLAKLSSTSAKQRKQLDGIFKRLKSLEAQNTSSENTNVSGPSETNSQNSASTTTVAPNSSSGPTRIVRRTVTRTNTPAPQQSTTSTPAAEQTLETPPKEVKKVARAPLPTEAAPLFAEAKSRLLQFDYDGAELAFRTFIEAHPEDPQAGEAHYWIGETLYQRAAYAESGRAFTQMIRTFPKDQRAPEAIAKLARSLRLIGEAEKACRTLTLLAKNYPDASSLTQKMATTERDRSKCDA